MLVDEDLFNESMEFYDEFFNDKKEQEEFITSILKLDNNIPRCMLNMVRRHVSLADEMIELHKGRDVLGLFNLVVAIEALYKLAGYNYKKTKIIIDFFTKYVSMSDQEKVKKEFRICLGDDENLENRRNQEISIEEFARVIYTLRCYYAHEGNYWEFSFNCRDDDGWMITSLPVKLPDLSQVVEDRSFVTLLSITEIRRMIAFGLIKFIRDYYQRILMP